MCIGLSHGFHQIDIAWKQNTNCTDFLCLTLFYSGIYFTGANTLTGTVPTETGLLTNLIELYFCKSFIKPILYYDSVLILCPLLINTYLYFQITFHHQPDDNKLTGYIPTEIELLTSLESLYLSK